MDEFVAKYRTAGVLVDTNILLLHVVGLVDVELIGRFKRTEQFVQDDFETLKAFLDLFSAWVVTPNILTEVSNLADKMKGRHRDQFYVRFTELIDAIREEFVITVTVAKSPAFSRIGVTDAGILEAARGKYLVLTDDHELARQGCSEAIDIVNFNHLRQWVPG